MNAYMPAITSSNTTPHPPPTFFSIHDKGGSLDISKNLKRQKPKAISKKEIWRSVSATSIPTISSITISFGSSDSKAGSARLTIQTDTKRKPTQKIIYEWGGNLPNTKKRRREIKLPKVPGAYGIYPTPKPVAKKTNTFAWRLNDI
jgi:hypothetical protein